MPRLTLRGNEHKPRNIAKEYRALFLYKAPAKGITLQENEETFKSDFFFLSPLRNFIDKRVKGAEIIERIVIKDELAAWGDTIL